MPRVMRKDLPAIAERGSQSAGRISGAIEAEKDRKLRELIGTPTQRYQQARIVDSESGKAMAGVFNPLTGEYETSDFELGFAPATDPETGLQSDRARLLQQTRQDPMQPPVQPQQPGMGAPTAPEAGLPQQQPMEQQYRPTPVQRKAIDSAQKELRQTPGYKESVQKVQEIQQLRPLAEAADKDPSAARILGVQVAHMLRQGRITEGELMSYVQDRSAVGQIRDNIHAFAQGTISPETLESVKFALEITEQTAQQQAQMLQQHAAQNLEAVYDVPSDFALQRFQTPMDQIQTGIQPPERPSVGDQATGVIDRLRGFLRPEQAEPEPAPEQGLSPRLQRILELLQQE